VAPALFVRRKNDNEVKEVNSEPQSPAPPPSTAEREADAIYQRGRLVARIKEPEIDEVGKEVRFTEIYQSDDLLLSDECEFREFIVVVRRVTYATREANPERSRILRGVVAEIIGRRNH
jgi:hypothetical protein